MSDQKSFDISLLGYLIPNLQAFYDILSETKRYFLPNFNSKCITEDYLLSIAKEEIFTIKKDNLKFGTLRKKVFIPELIGLLEAKVDKPLGFTEDRVPDKEWLVHVLYSVDSQNAVFKAPTSGICRELPANFFEDVVLNIKRYKGRGLFKKKKDEIEADKTKQQLRKEQRKRNQLERLKKKMKMLEEDLNLEQENNDEHGLESSFNRPEVSAGDLKLESSKNKPIE